MQDEDGVRLVTEVLNKRADLLLMESTADSRYPPKSQQDTVTRKRLRNVCADLLQLGGRANASALWHVLREHGWPCQTLDQLFHRGYVEGKPDGSTVLTKVGTGIAKRAQATMDTKQPPAS